MPKQITKLTPKQEAQMKPWAERWIEIGLRTGETNWDTFDKYMPICFKKAGLEYPKRVVRVSSPLVGAFAASIAGKILNGGNKLDAVGGAVGGAVRDAVGDAVGGAVGDAVEDAVRDAVGDAVGGAVRDAVGDAVREKKLNWHYWLGGQFWVGWGWYNWGSPSFVSFFTEVCGLELAKDIQERAEAYSKVCQSVNYIWPNKDFVMVCARPKHIHRDERGRLHSIIEQAIEYPDGWGLYRLHGVAFEKPLWEKIVQNKISGKEILSLKNTEQKMAAIKVLGMEKVFESIGAKLIDKSERGNELYLVENIFSQPAKFIKKTCPSTGRIYIEGVDPKIEKADEAVAWQMELTPQEYTRMRVET